MESRHDTDDAAATHAMLLGTANAITNNFASAVSHFNDARAEMPHPSILAETAYNHARALWQVGNFKVAREVLAEALEPREDILYARALSLSAWLYVAEQKTRQANEDFERALAAFHICKMTDVDQLAKVVYALAIAEAEIFPNDPGRLDRELEAIEWTMDLLPEHVQILRHVGLAYAHLGQHDRAMERFGEASQLDPRSAWSVLCVAEMANLMHARGETVSAKAFRSIACRKADSLVDWAQTQGEATIALLVLALAIARAGDAPLAQHYFDMFQSYHQLEPLSAFKHDSRLATYELHVQAVIIGAAGDMDAAHRLLQNVRDRWRKIGYSWRAKEAAIDDRSLTHRDVVVEHDSPEQPPQISSAVMTAAKFTLTRTQARVLTLLAAGNTQKKIGEQMSISKYTVRNHLQNIYRISGLKRHDLITQLARDANLLHVLAS